ncbi:hypothetical protein IWZ03DRAFT_165698 [Phyllosticta citriasiana]|uniref:Secreted protein n=1 Tax=Phyllosticta citriasiana TaxID=595635 RepID=A0ABR1KQE5_9PEZI
MSPPFASIIVFLRILISPSHLFFFFFLLFFAVAWPPGLQFSVRSGAAGQSPRSHQRGGGGTQILHNVTQQPQVTEPGGPVNNHLHLAPTVVGLDTSICSVKNTAVQPYRDGKLRIARRKHPQLRHATRPK